MTGAFSSAILREIQEAFLDNQMESTEDSRPGASSSPASLPMVVWLRGDEDDVEEFSLDADQVMARLGIKRSRLTQISGKELRVGRIRIDRYTRPVFRPADVEAYLAKTRAPTSHQASGRLIGKVLERLEDQRQDMQAVLQAGLTRFEQSLGGARAGLAGDLQAAGRTTIGPLEQELHNLRLLLDRLTAVLDRQGQGVRNLLEDLRRQQETGQLEWTGYVELQAREAAGRHTARQQIEDLTNQLPGLEKQLARALEDLRGLQDLPAQLRNSTESQQRRLERLERGQTTLEERLPVPTEAPPAPLPRRRRHGSLRHCRLKRRHTAIILG